MWRKVSEKSARFNQQRRDRFTNARILHIPLSEVTLFWHTARRMKGLERISRDLPVLIAGPTASGKSNLALEIASRDGGQIVNADALQVFANWRILTARPSIEEEAQAPHTLYGHVAHDCDYSVGHWLREVKPILRNSARPIIVGGTGLYFSALTEGLAEIPEIPTEVRATATAKVAEGGLAALVAEIDAVTAARIDTENPMRVQRAWEVQHATGRSLASWQDDTPPPSLPFSEVFAIVVDAPKEWLNPRIETRFDKMLDDGALDEVRANLPEWSPNKQSSKAIGASELVDFLRGKCSLDDARNAALTATRQYAKRQRSWFRARMRDWHVVDATRRQFS